ncbi:hypothetical protein J6590_038535, partial [Homalodisca vitripennis]
MKFKLFVECLRDYRELVKERSNIIRLFGSSVSSQINSWWTKSHFETSALKPVSVRSFHLTLTGRSFAAAATLRGYGCSNINSYCQPLCTVYGLFLHSTDFYRPPRPRDDTLQHLSTRLFGAMLFDRLLLPIP